MKGIKLVVSYDGTDFAGWQLQPGQRTIQGELEHALESIAGHFIRVRAAGRTDAGVHAQAQVVAFDTERELPMRNWVFALNSNLPLDMAVKQATECEPGYDPRHDAVEKSYRYLMHLGVVRDPLLRNRVWHLGRLVQRTFPDRNRLDGSVHRLNIIAMREAARSLIGTHDFTAFCASDDEHDNKVRTLYEVSHVNNFAGSPDLLGLEIRGSAFLKHMVRIIAGTLVEVGRDRMTTQRFSQLLNPAASRQEAGETAPARGLTLVSVKLGRGEKSGSI